MLVIDASAALELLLQTRRAKEVKKHILEVQGSLHAPQLLDLEVLQVLRHYCRTENLPMARAHAAIEDLKDLPIHRHTPSAFLDRIWELRHNLTVYDAAYLALAEYLPAPLLTRDSRLDRTPGHEARVIVL